MSMSSPITKTDISNIKCLAPGHPVFLLASIKEDVVIKCEQQAHQGSRNVRDPASVMNMIDPSSRALVMSKTELMAIRDFARQRGVEADPQGSLLHFVNDALKPPLPGIALNRGRQTNLVWSKMKAKANLMDLEGVGKASIAGDKTGIRAFADALKRPGTLEKLGEILAVDCFNQNQDRFNFDGSKGMRWPPNDQGPPSPRLECLQNVGNVFVAVEAGGATVAGLDSYDPNSVYKDWESFNAAGWQGLFLRDDQVQGRAAVIKKVVADIETVLGPRNRKIALARKKRLPRNAEARIETGMKSGARKIKQFVKTKASAPGAPAGLIQRINALGW